ncbi:gamma-glutamyltransferase [Gemmatimonas sp.]|uniref:gamma-glutamyltransferase n=1 Tax=Gemmatimonas sp. TaxID=1962908 RepID=UPI003F6E8866
MRVAIAVSLAGLLVMSAVGQAQDRSQSRSMVQATQGVVASESVLASQVGARVLERGGNAVDAAIAMNAMMGLVAPMNDGIGGDMFAIVYDAKTKQLYGLNASGWAPRAMTPDYLRGKGHARIPSRGIDAATVPGAVKGWEALHRRFGKMPMAGILQPAIQYAEQGFPVGEVVSVYWSDSEEALRADSATARTYLINGKLPKVGDVFRNPDLAWSYRQIATKGAAAFYTGAIAQKLLASQRRHGGVMNAADLADYDVEWVTPISTTYRGWTVYELPPNGQGIAALEMLNIMERFPLASMGHNSVQSLHHLIEAKKLAYLDMQRYNADPRFAKVPVTQLLSKSYAAQRAKLINTTRATCNLTYGTPEGTDNGTTYLSAVDRDGNMVSFIQSNYSTVGFGAGLVADGTGFVWHNRGGGFTLDANSPNIVAGRKRPLHTIIPGFMEKGPEKIAFGIMGGWNQSQAHAQFVANIVDFGMNIQGALDAPRFSKETFPGCDVNLEARIARSTRDSLSVMGHELVMRGDYSSTRMGSGQAVYRNFVTGLNAGASDPRKDGAAIAELLPAPPAAQKR